MLFRWGATKCPYLCVSEKIYNRLKDKSQTLPELKNFVYIFQSTARRKSVFAETYDPEEENDNEQSTIYPNSDLQCKVLMELVKDILLLRSIFH